MHRMRRMRFNDESGLVGKRCSELCMRIAVLDVLMSFLKIVEGLNVATMYDCGDPNGFVLRRHHCIVLDNGM